MAHDLAITEHHAVWLGPRWASRESAGRGMPYAGDDRHGARLGVVRRDDPDAGVRWFEIDPCLSATSGNACEDASCWSPAEFVATWEPIPDAMAHAGRQR